MPAGRIVIPIVFVLSVAWFGTGSATVSDTTDAPPMPTDPKPIKLALLASGAVETALKGQSGAEPLTGSLGFMFSSGPDSGSGTTLNWLKRLKVSKGTNLHETVRGLVSVATNSSAVLSGSREDFLRALLSDSPNQPGIENFVSLDYDRDWEYSSAGQSYGYRVFASSATETWQAQVNSVMASAPETITRLGMRIRWTMINIQPESDNNAFSTAIEAGVGFHWVGSRDDQAVAVRDSALTKSEWSFTSIDLGLEVAVRQLRAIVSMPFLLAGPARDRTSRNTVQFVLEAPLLEVARARNHHAAHPR